VMDEAIEKKTDLIISYHPPLFQPIKSITSHAWKTRNLLRAIENKIAIYSPHTAVDCMVGGVNDWLTEAFSKYAPSSLPIKPFHEKQYKIVIFGAQDPSIQKILGETNEQNFTSFSCQGVVTLSRDETTKDESTQVSQHRWESICPASSLRKVVNALHDKDISNYDIYGLEDSPHTAPNSSGQGRIVTLPKKVELQELVQLIKQHLSLQHVRVASPSDSHMVRHIAICAGAGSPDMLKVNPKPDLFWTGEFRHHEILDAVANRCAVVLCDHSNTERKYLEVRFKDILLRYLENSVTIDISTNDHEPLRII